ncbi:tail protein [Actinomadura pelletieri DSM 43383]|uniref:Tail protein n=1 Tax=Actinomadura pelletieri DSM 43383 TaxID=1120940 RepID=A0A495QBL5_9ACTN|nr:tail protein [Actinomadura pelletieri DSM 43383]
MPILITQQTRPDPGPSPERELATVTWTSGSGTETILSDWRQGYTLGAGAKGLGMPQYQLYLRESGALDGDVVTGVRAKARQIFLPIVVYGEDRAEALAKRALLADAFDPLEVNRGGEGVLTVAEPRTEPRRIRAYYVEGMEGSEGRDEAGWNWARFGITLHAAEPYWQGPEITRSWGAGISADPVFPLGVPPAYPLRARNVQTIGESVRVECPGDARSYPRWTISGPAASGVRFVNRDLGAEWRLDRPLQAGDVVVVDCHPRRRTVTLGETNLWPDLAPGAQLWPLVPGVNEIDMLLGDVGETTRVELSFVPLHKTAYAVRAGLS